MKNNFRISSLILIFLLVISNYTKADDNLDIKAKKIEIDKKNSEIILTNKVEIKDEKLNYLKTDKASYNKTKKLIKTTGETSIITSQNYKINSTNVIFDDLNGKISSNFFTQIIDKEGNIIEVEMFNYDKNKNLFFSKGKIKVTDIKKNTYYFSEIYINELESKIVGSDLRAYLNDRELKVSEKNDPRIFANSLSISNNKSEMGKGIFTFCNIREEGKCPAWAIKADKIKHDPAKKTIYYSNAVLKVFDFPIFYFPKFFHPDPTVKRQTGFLSPSFEDSKNLGQGVTIPYFINLAKDKDLTLSPKIYFKENPLLLAEYRQDFEKSFLIVDAGYTDGYKRTSKKKEKGQKNHFFSTLSVDLFENDLEKENLEVKLQHLSNDTYHKVYKLNNSLIDSTVDNLENSVSIKIQNEQSFFGTTFTAYENIDLYDQRRYEYLAPYSYFSKNLGINENYGTLDFTSNLQVRNYEVNKQTEFFVNDLKWRSKKWLNKLGIENQFRGLFKTVNYESNNTDNLKDDRFNSEVKGNIDYLAKLPFFKSEIGGNSTHLLTPKLMFRYSPNNMRKLRTENKLNFDKMFAIDRINKLDIVEPGFSTTIGLEYEKKLSSISDEEDSSLYFSISQIINEKEDTDKPAPLNQRFSDVIGSFSWKPNEKIRTTYNYALDQNLNVMNYNEIDNEFTLGPLDFNIKYLEEKEHFGDQKYIKNSINYNLNENNKFSFANKRDLNKNSAEFYNMSYEYFNDCLKAQLLFRREFYTDRDIEPENSLWFNITFVPFDALSGPKIN